ncbi:MAG: DUF4349 domain-containing protein [Clostridia bacterium]|nr:DUF4349 domain-containing protein [Clostridia bacterium]
MKRFFAIVLSLVMIISLAACGAESARDSGSKYASERYAEDGNGWNESAPVEEAKSESSALTERKQIFQYDLSLKTSSYDELTERIRGEARALGGFVESMNQDEYDEYRYLTLVVRVPADKAEAFVDGIAGSAQVTSRSQDSEDVTLEYVDVETRLKNLEAERQALTAMMERAENMEDLITIQSRLSDIQYEIESYTARKNKIDELVGLSTITFSIWEVAREDASAEPEQGIWGKIGSGFMNSLANIGLFFRDLFVYLIIALPYLAIIAVIVLVIIWIIRAAVRKSRKRAQERTRAMPQMPPMPPVPQQPVPQQPMPPHHPNMPPQA